MGKDLDHEAGSCCETCRKYGDPATAPPPEPPKPRLQVRPQDVKIVVTCGGQTLVELLPDKDTIVVGRGAQADIVLKDGNISRKQCAFVFREDGVYMKDLGSTCGTWVDGHKVNVARLGDGSRVEMVDYVMRVVPR